MVNYDEKSSRLKLLELLAASSDTIIPGSVLTEKLNSSRQAVFKLVGALREEGVAIESVPQKGYILRNMDETDAMSPTMIDFMLMANGIFHSAVYARQTTSTQHMIKKLAMQDAPEGIVAVTDEQTEGRGRRGRTWQAPAGKNLLFSVLLRPVLRPGDVQLLNLAAGVAVRNVMRSYYNVQADLKWPNDILVNGKKICGILSEAAGEPDRIYYAVTGIGINVNFSDNDLSDEIKDTATSLLIEAGTENPRPKLLVRVLEEFAKFINMLNSPSGKAEMLSAYESSCDTIGKDVRVIQDGMEHLGVARRITEQGALIVKIDGRDEIFAAADVHHLRVR